MYLKCLGYFFSTVTFFVHFNKRMCQATFSAKLLHSHLVTLLTATHLVTLVKVHFGDRDLNFSLNKNIC
jgi:hypothetical protein